MSTYRRAGGRKEREPKGQRQGFLLEDVGLRGMSNYVWRRILLNGLVLAR